MNRLTRAAGLAVATVALSGASYSAPLQAQSYGLPISAGAQPSLTTSANIDAALNRVDIQVAPAAAAPAKKSLFASLWTKAATWLGGGVSAAHAAPYVPQRPLTLDELVSTYAGDATADTEQDCLAKAVYFEARGESLEGQLAVAEVVMNRAASGRYPTTLCEVITQPWQFSFIQKGRFPTPDFSSDSWRKAVAVARIAQGELADTLPSDVLWYHATYVSPGWGKRLTRTAQIGLHIFYS